MLEVLGETRDLHIHALLLLLRRRSAINEVGDDETEVSIRH
jgi:hypothetical protein